MDLLHIALILYASALKASFNSLGYIAPNLRTKRIMIFELRVNHPFLTRICRCPECVHQYDNHNLLRNEQ